MSVLPAVPVPGASGSVAALVAQATSAASRPFPTAAIAAQLFGSLSLDERNRTALEQALCDGVAQVAKAFAVVDASIPDDCHDRLAAAGILSDPAILQPFWTAVRRWLVEAAMPMSFVEGERPSLLARLAQDPRPPVADAAVAMLLSEAAVPREAAEALVWAVAGCAEIVPGVETVRSVVSSLTTEPPERILARELMVAGAAGALIDEALADRQLRLTIALLAQAAALPLETAGEIVLDHDQARLLVMLRAGDIPRDTCARIGFALFEADRGYAIDHFADLLDVADALTVERARAVVQTFDAPAIFHAARRAGCA